MKSTNLKTITAASFLVGATLLSGCSNSLKDLDGSVMTPLMPAFSDAQLSSRTSTYVDLLSLPKPKGRIVASVYRFKDLTGQYRPKPDNGFSTAVSQGTNTMLIEALSDSGWFVPIEREGLQHILTERKFKRSKNANSPGGLSPMLSAQIVLEGGVISYESATQTGGTGARFLGIGGSEQYEVDQVTVSLRAVNVDNGEILNNVTVTKNVLSKELQAGVFRYVDYKQLLEVDSGVTTNEPVDMAVRAAIEAAVVHMIVDGIEQRHWTLQNPKEFQHPVIQRYAKAKPKLITYNVPETPVAEPEEKLRHEFSWDEPTYSQTKALPAVKVASQDALPMPVATANPQPQPQWVDAAKNQVSTATRLKPLPYRFTSAANAAVKPSSDSQEIQQGDQQAFIQAADVSETNPQSKGIFSMLASFLDEYFGTDLASNDARLDEKDLREVVSTTPMAKPSTGAEQLSQAQREQLVRYATRPEVKLDALEQSFESDESYSGGSMVVSQNRKFADKFASPAEMRAEIKRLRHQVVQAQQEEVLMHQVAKQNVLHKLRADGLSELRMD